jgi:hypothetical protein
MTRTAWASKALLLLAAPLTLTSCAKSTLGDYQPICANAPSARYASAEQVPDEEWVSLLLSEEVARQDCTGQSLTPVELPRRCGVPAQPEPPRALRRQAERATLHEAPGDFALIWLPVDELRDGHKLGLVGFVHVAEKALSLVGIGTIELPAEHVNLRLRQVGSDELLFAEGKACPGRGPARSCERTLELFLLHDGRFVPLEVRDRNNRCTGAAEVPLALTQDMRLDNGTIRRFDLTATYSVVDNELLVTEQLVTTDRAANSSEENARVFRKSDGRRTLQFTGAYFVSDRESLWSGMREARGTLLSRDPSRHSP